MGLVPVYDPLLDDLQDKSVIVDSAAPTGQTNGYFSVVDDIVYYFAGSHRYKITATLDDPVTGFLLMEDGFYFLQEDGASKIQLEA